MLRRTLALLCLSAAPALAQTPERWDFPLDPRDWKLVAAKGDPWELYDLANDAGETTNLAAQHPKRLRDLVARWNQWAESCNDPQ